MTTESLWSKAQPRGISRSLPRKKAGLALYTKKMYIKPTSHCLILYQYIMGELYTIISEGKFTQSVGAFFVYRLPKMSYDIYMLYDSEKTKGKNYDF